MKTTAANVIPTVAGTPFGGGFYVGRFFLGAQAYALVVSPKGEETELAGHWNKTPKKVAGALSYNDGLANTDAMAKAGSALAKAFRTLTLGGFDDWYLPSRLESMMLFSELHKAKGFEKDGAEAFAGKWYWTSQQYAPASDYAWAQGFAGGGQIIILKGDDDRARAVRRSVIQ